jgi:hypothetical protein
MDWEAMKRASEALSTAMMTRVERDWLSLHYRVKLSAPPPYIGLSSDRSSLVYFIDCGRYTKVGTTFDIRNRMSGIETHNPFEISLWGLIRGNRPLESQLHVELGAYRKRNEWFELDAEARTAIRSWLKKNGGEVSETEADNG